MNMRSAAKMLLLCIVVLPLRVQPLHAQRDRTYPQSPVFRNYNPRKEQRDDRGEGLRQQINIFLLERDAANGDPLAQQELGVRYLTGRGVDADTVKSGEWLRLAASQGLISSMYNYALLRNNGWGVEWNPFDAYRMFLAAAEAGMPEAQYVVGIFHTDDLVLKRDWERAYHWIVLAEEAGYEPAVRAKAEILRRGHIHLQPDSTVDLAATEKQQQDDAPQEDWAPVLLDFSQERTASIIPTSQLLGEFLASIPMSAQDSVRFTALLNGDAAPSTVAQLNRMARYGNPEAMVLLARLLTENRQLTGSTLQAAGMLVTALYLESGRAGAVLVDLLRTSTLQQQLPQLAYGDDPEAQYVWATLRALELDMRLAPSQALDMLRRAAASGHQKALVQLGLCYASGRWVDRDGRAAIRYYEEASALDDMGARVRLASAVILGKSEAMTLHEALDICDQAVRLGSIVAEVTLAASYERGIGRSANTGIAVHMYRDGAIRGSRTAFAALRRLHEERRPDDPLFRRSDL
ncbi:SEL1-like repeat protein [bacterium]|nr:SEL1-like repeat protein [bacterium]